MNSWGGGLANPTLTAAFNYIQTHGRAGLGVASFNAAGNAAAGVVPGLNYATANLQGIPAGNWVFEWRYTKDGSAMGGEDSVWLGNIQFPGGAAQRFDTLGLPSGWSSSGNASWSVIDDPAHSYGTGRYVAKAGTIGNSQTSNLRSPTISVAATGSLNFSFWVSSEASFDRLRLFTSFNGGAFVEQFAMSNFSGVPSVTSNVSYPASLSSTIAVGASTDWDYRSHYSQYGSALDIVAPSSGGYAAIATTDRTGAAGVSPTDYSSTFNGTSAATPLAAGIAALLLSKNWNLTTSQIRMLLQTTADKIGGNNGQTAYTNGFNSYYGYGRVNAAAALAATPTELIGDTSFNNVVTGQDAVIVINHLGTRGPVGDADHNHIVDMADYNLVLAHNLETGSFPPIPDLVSGSDLGVSNSDNITSDSTPTFDVVAPAGWYVQLYVDNVLQGSQQLGVNQSTYSFTTSGLSSALHTAITKVSENATLAAANLSNLSAPFQFTVDTAAPKVSKVLVGSTAWTPDFKTQLLATSRGNADGYFIPSGADQLDPIWFINANQVAVQFDGPVDVQETDLLLTGTSASYSIIGFGAGATANTWIWTLSAAIGNDDLTIALEATAGTAVQDTAGNKLDGEWTNVSSSYPSGNGTAGGNFSFRFDVLPGDVNQDRVVNIFDLNYVSSNWGIPGGSPNGDLNGDGVVNIFDINGLSSYWGTSNVDGGNFMMMGGGLSFDAAFAAYLRDIANFRKDKGLLSWLDDNSAEELGQAIEGINSESSPKEVDQIQSILDGFFTGLSDYMELENEMALV